MVQHTEFFPRYTSMEDLKKGETSEVQGASTILFPLSTITQELMYTRVRVMENPECSEWLEDERKRLEEEGVWEVPPEAVPIGLNQLCTGMQERSNGGCHGDSGRFSLSSLAFGDLKTEMRYSHGYSICYPSRRATYSPRGVLCAGRGGVWWRKGLRKAKSAEHLHQSCSIC